MTLNLSIPRDDIELGPRITVVGVGGAGGNAVSNMIRSNLVGCEFVVCNTDAQAMKQSLAERRIQLGVGVTRGLGAGSRPEVGRIAAEEALDEIMGSLDGSNMVFITAGMGGGTGTGAAPVIARAAREAGILTVGVVTKPFHFEGTHRMRLAESGILELQKFVDTLIIIPNQNLFRVANERTTFADAFKMADDVLHSGVRGVTDLMVMPGLINLDFADIRAVMSEMGKAMMGTGEAEGDRRAIDAAEAAISNPLLEDVSMKGARGVLINITGGLDMTLFEVDEAANRIREEVDPDANIIFGSTFDEKLAGKMRISVVATGIDAEPAMQGKPIISLVSDRSREEPVTVTAVKPTTPAEDFAAATALEAEAAQPRTQAIEAAAVNRDVFVASRAVETPAPRAAEPPIKVQQQPAPKARTRAPTLFERVTGAGRLLAREEAAAAAAAPAPAPSPAAPSRPAAPAVQPRLGTLDPGDRVPQTKEDDLLDIPAFLRRQAN
jgi:cell division protein FtsZ